MPRPRAFDPDAVLDAAQRVFHDRGYEATSVQDLVDATGLSRSSLYGAWGDKHGLYLAVLDRYAQAGRQAGDALCDGRAPLDAIRAVLASYAGAAPRGCLLVNAAAERSGVDAATAQRAGRARTATRDRMARLVAQARQRGEIDAGRSDDEHAQLLTGVLYGLRGLQTAGAAPADLADVVDGAMRAIQAR